MSLVYLCINDMTQWGGVLKDVAVVARRELDRSEFQFTVATCHLCSVVELLFCLLKSLQLAWKLARKAWDLQCWPNTTSILVHKRRLTWLTFLGSAPPLRARARHRGCPGTFTGGHGNWCNNNPCNIHRLSQTVDLYFFSQFIFGHFFGSLCRHPSNPTPM